VEKGGEIDHGVSFRKRWNSIEEEVGEKLAQTRDEAERSAGMRWE